MWNVPSNDWKASSAAMIEQRVASQIRGGDIILLHDGDYRAMGADRAQTVIATDNLIRRYRDPAYEFVTVDEMLTVGHQPPAAG
jgi:peptidoglycan/xylan/chitin deacetylase (PgdA/CDA1 family)